MGSIDTMDERLAAQCEALADGLGKTVSMARALAASGRAVDLEGLDRHIGLLCAKALDLPPELGRAQRVHLVKLRADLEALSALLSSDGPPPPRARKPNPYGQGH